MRTKLYLYIVPIVLVISCCCFFSCNKIQNSPYVTIGYVLINDSLCQDTKIPLHMGDTLYMGLLLQGYDATLDYFQINVDRTAFKDSICGDSTELAEIFTPFSQPEKGHYLFQPNITTVRAVWALTPRHEFTKQEKPYTVDMIIKSHATAQENYNPFTRSFWVSPPDTALVSPSDTTSVKPNK